MTSDNPNSNHAAFARSAVLAAAILVLGLVASSAAYRLSRPFPLTPWESAIVADAYRLTRALAVYADPETDHATHMYGPLITVATAGVFHITGVSIQSPRWIALLSAGITCWVLTLVTVREQSWPLRIVAFAAFASTFFVARAAYAETRPDAVSLMFALLGLVTLYRGVNARCWYRLTAGAGLLLIAALFKQPAAAMALVPVAVAGIAMLFRIPPGKAQPFLWPAVLFSIAGIVATAILLCTFAPNVWQYVVDVPARFPLDLSKLPRAIGLLTLHLLLPLSLLFVERRRLLSQLRAADHSTRWLVGSCAVCVPVSVAAFIKAGGGENLLLPALLSVTALAMTHAGTILRRSLLGAVCGALLVLQTVAQPRALAWAFHARHGDPTYVQVIRSSDESLQDAICPDDPTIPLLLGRDPGRSLDCELDFVGQREFPPYLVQHIRSARHVIRVHSTWDAHITASQMRQWGFEPVEHPLLATPTYSLWKNVEARAE